MRTVKALAEKWVYFKEINIWHNLFSVLYGTESVNADRLSKKAWRLVFSDKSSLIRLLGCNQLTAGFHICKYFIVFVHAKISCKGRKCFI